MFFLTVAIVPAPATNNNKTHHPTPPAPQAFILDGCTDLLGHGGALLRIAAVVFRTEGAAAVAAVG